MRLRIEPPRDRPFHRECAEGAIVIGRAADVDLSVNDASMSRRHVRVFAADGGWFVEDLGARNGTTLNGQRLTAPARLGHGDVLRLGETAVIVDASPGAVEGPGSGTIFRSARALQAATHAPASNDAASLERYASRLKLLNDVQRDLAAPISLDALLERVLQRLFDVLRPEDGLVLLRGTDGSLRQAAARRAPGSPGELVVSKKLVEEVVDKGAAALVMDAALDDRFAAARSLLAAGIRSIVAAPLADAEGTLGMVALYSRVHVRQFSEDDLELLVSLASAAALRVRNIALAEDAAARRVLERELAVAHDIQMGMLPRAMPRVAGLDLAAGLQPARAVGGDLYDAFVAGGDLWLIVADVAGKGVGAALFMAVAKTLFRALAISGGSLESVMTRLNAELARENDRQIFVTAFAARVPASGGVLDYSNAGHNLPMLVDAGGVRTLEAREGGPALGVIDPAAYAAGRLTLAPGATVVLYTDGVIDARDAGGAAFGERRLVECLAGCAGKPAEESVATVMGTVATFASGAPQEDDITVLALRLPG
jgi:serine phosphatase RsbU (regulator of sigma subunit)